MANVFYQPWVNDGRPYELVAYGRDLVDAFKSHGFTVYHYPDEPHLQARTPEDHTPFSQTGWPVKSPYGKGHGIDLMPKPGLDARSLTVFARKIIADKDAGVPGTEGVKYINWTDEQGRVWQTSWKPNKATTSNSDAGHIHVSLRSDCLARSLRTNGWDPIARVLNPPKPPEALMSKLVMFTASSGQLRIGDCVWSKPITADDIKHYRALSDAKIIELWRGKNGPIADVWVDEGPDPSFFGTPIESVGQISDAQAAAMAESIADQLAPLLGEDLADDVAVKTAAAVQADAAKVTYTTKPVVP